MAKKFDPAPKWTKNMRQFIVNQLAMWKPYKEVWLLATSDELKDTVGIEPLDPNVYGYDMFRMRCKRIPKNEIAIAHEEWKKQFDGIRWAEEKARVQGMSDMIDKLNEYIDKGDFDKDTTGTMSSIVSQLRGLYEQIRKERSAEADRQALAASGTRVLLANPKNVQLDTDYVSELLLVYRNEIGGLHNLDLDALNKRELEMLRDACTAAIERKIDKLDEVDTEEMESDNDDS